MPNKINIVKHVNAHSKSNTYILSIKGNEGVWVLDPGDSNFLLNWLNKTKKNLLGILVTHSHIDHIYGINDLQKEYPGAKVYASVDAKVGMLSTKLNLSHYHEEPYIVERKDVIIIEDKQKLELWKGIFIIAHHTPGHNTECLSYEVENMLFTGDSLLPGVKVFTKFNGGNKIEASNTIIKIFNTFPLRQIIYPGHGAICTLEDLKNENNIL